MMPDPAGCGPSAFRGAAQARLLAACLLAGALASVALRPDNNWDLRSYHLYNGWAALHGRLDTDLNAAGIQTWLNPLLDIPYAALALGPLRAWPRLMAAAMGLPYGALAFVVLGIGAEAAARMRLAPPWGWLMAAAGLTGSLTVSEIGTTMNDIPVAVILLGGVWAALRGRTAAAGLAFGAAAALKPTALVFGPAGLALLAGLRGWAPREAARFCLFWAIGWLALGGVWAWMLWRRFGNPLFPLLNGLFASPWAGPANLQDTRFLPRGLAQALFYPFWWLTGRPWLAAEIGIRDPRFALAMLAMPVLALRWRALPPAVRGVALFVAAGYAAWEAAFSILRYAVPLEAMLGVVIVAALAGLTPPRRRWAAAALLALLLAGTNYGFWGRMHGYGPTVAEVPAIPLPPGSVVALAGKPLGFMVPFLRGEGFRVVGLAEAAPGTLMDRAIRRRLAEAPARAALLAGPADAGTLAAFGLHADPAACTPVRTPRQSGILLCTGTALRLAGAAP